MSINKRKIWYAAIIAVSAIAVVVIAVVYSLFASKQIFDESKEHLNEIYRQVRTTFYQAVENNRKLMYSWEKYIENSVDIINGDDETAAAERDREFIDFIEKQRENSLWGFTNFYFIGGEHIKENENDYNYVVDCKNIYGNDVKFRIRRSLHGLLEEDKGGVIGMREDLGESGDNFMLFAVRVGTPKTFKGMRYTSIGISFNTVDMANLLTVEAFDRKGQFYISLPDGTVLLQTNPGHLISNLLDHFGEDDVSVNDLNKLKNDWKSPENEGEHQASDTVLIDAHGVEYYMTYMPVGFGDWMMVGIVPSEIVNGSMGTFRLITIVVMGAIFALVAAAIAFILITNGRRRVKEQMVEIKSREGLLDLLTADTNDVFVMFSTETFKSEYVSNNVERVLGLDTEKVRADARTLLEASEEEHAMFTTERLRMIDVNNAWTSELAMRNVKTNEKYWVHLSLYHSIDGAKDYCVIVLSDRTKDMKMREKLEDALIIAKNANAAKSNFLSNMSHDIRTPMNAIIGYATLLAKDADNAERVRAYTRKITYSGQHLLSLINDILDMSKIESGKTSLNPTEFSMPQFIEELYAIISSQAKAKKHQLDIHTKGNMPEFVVGDKLRLNQVLFNILSNAIKYTPEGGTIELRVETMKQTVHRHSHLKFVVSDNGIGMSKEFLETIFDPFSREQTESTRGIQGTGLGMAITKNLVNLMGGVISVESELGKGSTFTVELELAVADNIADDEEFWKYHNVTRVLVVDDEEDICMDIRELMADTGVDVKYALSGKEALKMVSDSLSKDEFNIILLDWKMPDMDGVETARQIRAKVGRDLPIMVLTSYSFEDIEDEAKEAGIDLFLSKPFFVSNFRRAVMQIRNDGAGADITPESDGVSLAGLKVLAAEDNEINAEILVELLDIEEVHCEIATNGQEALDKFAASKPGDYDIIFMDIQMPVMNGYDAARAIRACKHKNAKSIPIIAMTANAFDDDVKAALDAGMNAHLSKPIDMGKLKHTVAKIREETKTGRGKK